MKKLLILLFLFFLALGSTAGYIYLSEKIIIGKIKIANGEKQLREGKIMLAKGKARLASGQQKMSPINRTRNVIKSIPILSTTANNLPISKQLLKLAGSKINEVNKLIAKGKQKIRSGEQQLKDGHSQLAAGKKRLKNAEWILMVCQIGIIIFTSLLVFFLYHWRTSLKEILTFKNNYSA